MTDPSIRNSGTNTDAQTRREIMADVPHAASCPNLNQQIQKSSVPPSDPIKLKPVKVVVDYPDSARVASLMKCHNLLFATKLAEAEFECSSRVNRCYLHAIIYAEVQTWRSFLTDDPRVHNLALERLTHARAMATRILDYSDPNPSLFASGPKDKSLSAARPMDPLVGRRIHFAATLAIAEIQLLRAMVYFKMEGWVNGGLHVRKSWKMYEAAQQHFKEVCRLRADQSAGSSDPRAEEDLATDAFLEGALRWGVGAFYFGVSQTPPTFKWIVSALGFVGNRDDGIRELELSMNLPSPRAPLSALVVGMIYSFYDDEHDKLKEILDRLQEQHPESATVAMGTAYYHRMNDSIEESSKWFARAEATTSQALEWQQSIRYELGHNYFLQNDFVKCAEICEWYYNECPSKSYKPMCLYKLGMCYWMLDRRDEIAALYKKIPSVARPKFNYDMYALRKSKEFLKNGCTFFEFDIPYNMAMNFAEGRMWQAARDELEKCKPILQQYKSSFKRRAEHFGLYYYLKGLVFKEVKLLDVAESALQSCLKLSSQIKYESYVIPSSLVVLADIELSRSSPNIKTARELLKRAKKYSDYDFENPTSFRINKFLARSKKMKKAAAGAASQ
mmetsp:Transcript_8860/g.27449  ORF Transcript_8860/g.27449 Transcript_8860/m.27449 type:complete len:617 (-) Transcript_8860:29-1879(-)